MFSPSCRPGRFGAAPYCGQQLGQGCGCRAGVNVFAVCLCVYMCLLCVCKSVCANVCVRECVCKRVCVCMCVYVCAPEYVWVCECGYLCVRMRMCEWVCVRFHSCCLKLYLKLSVAVHSTFSHCLLLPEWECLSSAIYLPFIDGSYFSSSSQNDRACINTALHFEILDTHPHSISVFASSWNAGSRQ